MPVFVKFLFISFCCFATCGELFSQPLQGKYVHTYDGLNPFVSNFIPFDSVTIEFYYEGCGLAPSGVYMLGSFHAASGRALRWIYNGQQDFASLLFDSPPNSGGYTGYQGNSHFFTMDTVFHIALTYQRTSNDEFVSRLFCNGYLVREIDDEISTYLTLPNDGAYAVGMSSQPYQPYPALPGYYDQLRISNNIRYSSDFIPDDTLHVDATTVALWSFDTLATYTPYYFFTGDTVFYDIVSNYELNSNANYIMPPFIEAGSTAMDTICYLDTLKVQGVFKGAEVKWSPGFAFVDSTADYPVINVSDTTIEVVVTIGDSLGCRSLSDTAWLYIPPVPSYQLSTDTIICKGDTTVLNISTSFNFHWLGSTALEDTLSASPKAFPTTAEEYKVAIYHIPQCQSFDSVLVDISAPVPSVQVDTTVCYGDSSIAKSHGGQSYVWRPDSLVSVISVDSVHLKPVTTTTFNLIVTDSMGCKDSIQFPVYVGLPPVKLGNDTADCDTISLTSQSGFTNYLWNTGSTSPTIMTDTSGSFIVNTTDFLGCTSSDTIEIVVSKPSVVIAGRDLICENDSVFIEAQGNTSSYSWWPGPHFSDSTSTSPIFLTGSFVDSISVTALDTATGCAAIAVKKFSKLPDCVWPGDADNDGVVNNLDLLPIGVAFGYTDTLLTREHGSLYYRGQYAFYSDTIPSGINYKFINTNGDSLIDHQDTLAVALNYNLTHNKMGQLQQTDQTDPALFFDYHATSVAAGSKIVVPVHLGNSAVPASDIYGIAFSVLFSGPVDTSKVGVYLQDLWLAGNSGLSFQKVFSSAGRMDLAVVRTNQMDTTGFGELAKLELQLLPGTSPSKLELSFSDVKVINKKLEEQPVQQVSESINITTGVSAPEHPQFTLYPNPTDDMVIIRLSRPMEGNIVVFNTVGQQLMDIGISSDQSHYSLDVTNLAAGSYTVVIITPEGQFQQKLLIVE